MKVQELKNSTRHTFFNFSWDTSRSSPCHHRLRVKQKRIRMKSKGGKCKAWVLDRYPIASQKENPPTHTLKLKTQHEQIITTPTHTTENFIIHVSKFSETNALRVKINVSFFYKETFHLFSTPLAPVCCVVTTYAL